MNSENEVVEKFNIGDLALAFPGDNNIVGEVVTIVDFRDINYSGYFVRNSKGETYSVDKDQLIGIDGFEDLITKRQEFLLKREEKTNQIELTPQLYKEMLSYIEELEEKLEKEEKFKSEVHWNYDALKAYVLMDKERTEKTLIEKEKLIEELEDSNKYLVELVNEYKKEDYIVENSAELDSADIVDETLKDFNEDLIEDHNKEPEEQDELNNDIEESELNLEELQENKEEHYVRESKEQEERGVEESGEKPKESF